MTGAALAASSRPISFSMRRSSPWIQLLAALARRARLHGALEVRGGAGHQPADHVGVVLAEAVGGDEAGDARLRQFRQRRADLVDPRRVDVSGGRSGSGK